MLTTYTIYLLCLQNHNTPNHISEYMYPNLASWQFCHRICILHSSPQNNYGAPLPVAKDGRPTSDLPIFWEFVQYVIEARRDRMDEHWKPTVAYCSMCILRYHYVIKFEDYINEGTQFLRQSNLEQYLPENALHEHTNTNRPGEMSR